MPKSFMWNVDGVARAFCDKNFIVLRSLSNELVRDAALDNDFSSAKLAVIAYALHKFSVKDHVRTNPKWNSISQKICGVFDQAINSVKKSDFDAFEQQMDEIISVIVETDAALGNYAMSLLDKARIKQASLAYSYGLSLGKACELTGAQKRDVLSYIGVTKTHDEDLPLKGIKSRVSALKKFLS